MNPMITTNQKKTYNRHTETREKEHKHTIKENHQTTMEKTKRRRTENYKNN